MGNAIVEHYEDWRDLHGLFSQDDKPMVHPISGQWPEDRDESRRYSFFWGGHGWNVPNPECFDSIEEFNQAKDAKKQEISAIIEQVKSDPEYVIDIDDYLELLEEAKCEYYDANLLIGRKVQVYWGCGICPVVKVNNKKRKFPIAIEFSWICSKCKNNRGVGYLVNHSAVIDPDSGEYIADLRDDIAVCSECQKKVA